VRKLMARLFGALGDEPLWVAAVIAALVIFVL
jgi:hypothetical protein